jgi:hypothetical protein
MQRLSTATTKLEKAVQRIINAHAPNYGDGVWGFQRDLEQGGCVSGLVSELIYYADTLPFYRKHKKEIDELVYCLCEETGQHPADLFTGWEKSDSFAVETHNQNLLAWVGFEETARELSGVPKSGRQHKCFT